MKITPFCGGLLGTNAYLLETPDGKILIDAPDETAAWLRDELGIKPRKIGFDEAFARYSPGAQLALQALKTNLAIPGFRVADSLAIPGHSMIEPLWRGRLETGTLLYADGLKRVLCKTDLRLEQTLRKAARAVRARVSS